MALQKVPLIGMLLLLTFVCSSATPDGPICPSAPAPLSRAHFPEGFVFGTATAAYQVEGAVHNTCRGPGLWDVYCRRNPEKCSGVNGDRATDFYHRYKEDIKLMKDLNTDAFRFSIAWPRIFPNGRRDEVCKEGVQFYHNVINELIKYDIKPSVTIFHWDTPQALEDKYGGFLSDKIVNDFRDYAEFVFQEYGDKVKNWITFNEPWVFSHAGYDVGKKAPGRCSEYANSYANVDVRCLGGRSGREVYIVSHNLLNAHAEAVEAFRQCKKCEGGKIGIAHSPAWFEPRNSNDPIDKASALRSLDFMLGWHLETTLKGDYPKIMKDVVGDRLPKFTDAQKKKLINSTDFVGLNYYTASFSNDHSEKPDPNKPKYLHDVGEWKYNAPDGVYIGSQPPTAAMPVYSRGFIKLLKHIKVTYDNPEIIIMENGYGEKLGKDASVEKGTIDPNRRLYLMKHLYAMHDAICNEGVKVTGYYAWSLMDNFEWQDGFENRFGLYYIDFSSSNLTRHEKLSAKYYRDFLGNTLRSSLEDKDEF